MLNYCILNGVSSRTIKGLLIQSLPPVAKPQMRTRTEQIDGRDGDTITPLGFSAYNKTLKIGLFGDYNVDQIIKFFTSEGLVIFSNEPDKFYKYVIVEQINFERLLRFRTADVVFHVQPFKFSSAENTVDLDLNVLRLKDWVKTDNGVTVSVEDDIMQISGTPTENTEFYVPIKPVTLDAGLHKWEIFTNGSGENNCRMRLIGTNPSDVDSFKQTDMLPGELGYAFLRSNLSVAKTFNYIWIYLYGGVDFSLRTQIMDTTTKQMKIVNSGNVFSKPEITIKGAGTIVLSINHTQVLAIDLDTGGDIIIDPEAMNAYYENQLKNRSVYGDYNKVILETGENVISWMGDIHKISFKNYSRWI